MSTDQLVFRRCVTAVLLAFALPLGAQGTSPPVGASTQYETREQLEALARTAASQKRTAEAWVLKSRLEKGDFREGDRIVVALAANPRPDTLQVRLGNVLRFAGMDDLSLDGVLRSELQSVVRRHLARYLRNPDVWVSPLLSLGVLGNVGAPGYYYMTADVVLRDAVMRAGGPRGSDLDKMTIRRGGEILWKADDVRVALADGLSLDRLHLRAGDEIFVPAPRRFNVATAALVASTALAIVASIIQLQR